MEQDPAVTPAPAAAPAALWEDCVDVFVAPAELFRRRAGDAVGPPLLMLLGLGVVFYLVLLPANSIAMHAAIADNPEAVRAVGEYGTLLQLIGALVVPVTYVGMVAFAALLLWLVSRLADTEPAFSRTMLIATYAAFVYLISQVAVGVALLLHGEVGLDVARHTSFGVLRFLGDSEAVNPVILALLRRFDVFAIWQAVLWGVGLAVVLRVGRLQATFTAAAVWLLFALPGIVMAGFGWGPFSG
jgi:hypothetical protein